MITLKKCPICGSEKISVYGFKFHCKKCGYIHDYQFNFPEEEVRALTQAQKGKEV